MFIKIKYFLFIIIIFFCIHYQNSAQSLYGYNGLLTIPTAQVYYDSELIFGSSFVHRNGIDYSRTDSDKIIGFVGLGFLPFLEVDFRITRNLKPATFEAIGDRTPSLRFLLKREEHYIPSVLIGWHDVFSAFGGPDANNFNSSYIVLSKNIQMIGETSIHLTAGYGVKIFKAANYQFAGLFGGISFALKNKFELMGEYDAERFNAGLRMTFFNHIKLIGGFMDLKYFSGGIALSFNL